MIFAPKIATIAALKILKMVFIQTRPPFSGFCFVDVLSFYKPPYSGQIPSIGPFGYGLSIQTVYHKFCGKINEF
jgi:hypothetical protein